MNLTEAWRVLFDLAAVVDAKYFQPALKLLEGLEGIDEQERVGLPKEIFEVAEKFLTDREGFIGEHSDDPRKPFWEILAQTLLTKATARSPLSGSPSPPASPRAPDAATTRAPAHPSPLPTAAQTVPAVSTATDIPPAQPLRRAMSTAPTRTPRASAATAQPSSRPVMPSAPTRTPLRLGPAPQPAPGKGTRHARTQTPNDDQLRILTSRFYKVYYVELTFIYKVTRTGTQEEASAQRVRLARITELLRGWCAAKNAPTSNAAKHLLQMAQELDLKKDQLSSAKFLESYKPI